MSRYEKACDGMPRDELVDEEVVANQELRNALIDYSKLETLLSHDD